MSGPPNTIWSYGIAMMDVVVRPLDSWPDRGRLSVCDEGAFAPGGVALNTAVTVARLGGLSGLIAGLGRDAAADGVLALLESEGVSTELLVRTDRRSTGFCIVAIASDGEKSLVAHLGSNRELTPDRVDWNRVSRGDYLHVGGCFAVPELSGETLVAALSAGRRRGLRLSIESAWDVSGRWLQDSEKALPWLDVFMTSNNEAEDITGCTDPAESCETLAAAGPRIVVVKAGAAGCWVAADGQLDHHPAFKVPVVDATGAGDCFCGGFLLALARGWDVGSAADFANAVAAMNVTAVGATAGVRSTEATLAFMAAADRSGP